MKNRNWRNRTMRIFPAIVQEENGDVLSLFWMNGPSLKKSLDTGKTWRYSRSKKKVVMKGAESGNVQLVKKIAWDCDKDALLMTVRQSGTGACHTGSWSCFFPEKTEENVLEQVFGIIKDRKKKMPEASYTASIIGDKKKIAEKLKEECDELIEALETKNDSEVVWEAADLLYFLMAGLANRGVELGEVFRELARRRKPH